jgi:hypothetical protein
VLQVDSFTAERYSSIMMHITAKTRIPTTPITPQHAFVVTALHHMCVPLSHTLLLQGPLAPNARLRAAVRLFDGLIQGSGETAATASICTFGTHSLLVKRFVCVKKTLAVPSCLGLYLHLLLTPCCVLSAPNQFAMLHITRSRYICRV